MTIEGESVNRHETMTHIMLCGENEDIPHKSWSWIVNCGTQITDIHDEYPSVINVALKSRKARVHF